MNASGSRTASETKIEMAVTATWIGKV